MDFGQQKSNFETPLQFILLLCYYYEVVSELHLDHKQFFVVVKFFFINHWHLHEHFQKLKKYLNLSKFEIQ